MLTALHWLKQINAVIAGLLWGGLPLTGLYGFLTFLGMQARALGRSKGLQRCCRGFLREGARQLALEMATTGAPSPAYNRQNNPLTKQPPP